VGSDGTLPNADSLDSGLSQPVGGIRVPFRPPSSDPVSAAGGGLPPAAGNAEADPRAIGPTASQPAPAAGDGDRRWQAEASGPRTGKKDGGL